MCVWFFYINFSFFNFLNFVAADAWEAKAGARWWDRRRSGRGKAAAADASC